MQPLADGYYWFIPEEGLYDPEIVHIFDGVVEMTGYEVEQPLHPEGLATGGILVKGRFVGPLIPPNPEAT